VIGLVLASKKVCHDAGWRRRGLGDGGQCHSPWFVEGGMSTFGRPVWLGRLPAAGDAAAMLRHGGAGNGGEEGDDSASGVEREERREKAEKME
jgi:hypothetical protein